MTDTTILHRFTIKPGHEDHYLPLWRREAAVRPATATPTTGPERHGFHCLFAVVDRPQNMFTWSFDFDGDWEGFAAAQRPYYRDPARIALRGVFDYMADHTISPARQLDLHE